MNDQPKDEKTFEEYLIDAGFVPKIKFDEETGEPITVYALDLTIEKEDKR